MSRGPIFFYLRFCRSKQYIMAAPHKLVNSCCCAFSAHAHVRLQPGWAHHMPPAYARANRSLSEHDIAANLPLRGSGSAGDVGVSAYRRLCIRRRSRGLLPDAGAAYAGRRLDRKLSARYILPTDRVRLNSECTAQQRFRLMRYATAAGTTDSETTSL